jgi:hypothetical protein
MDSRDLAPADGPVLAETTVPRDTSLSTEVVRTVARAAETEPTDLPPLGNVVGPDRLDQLFAPERIEGLARFP